MARTYPPAITRRSGGTHSHSYYAENGLRTQDQYQTAEIETRRGPDGHLIVTVYGGDPGVEVRVGGRGEYRFAFGRNEQNGTWDAPVALVDRPNAADSVPVAALLALVDRWRRTGTTFALYDLKDALAAAGVDVPGPPNPDRRCPRCNDALAQVPGRAPYCPRGCGVGEPAPEARP